MYHLHNYKLIKYLVGHRIEGPILDSRFRDVSRTKEYSSTKIIIKYARCVLVPTAEQLMMCY